MTNKMLIGWWVTWLLTKQDPRVFPPASARTLTGPCYITWRASDLAHVCFLLQLDIGLFDDRVIPEDLDHSSVRFLLINLKYNFGLKRTLHLSSFYLYSASS